MKAFRIYRETLDVGVTDCLGKSGFRKLHRRSQLRRRHDAGPVERYRGRQTDQVTISPVLIFAVPFCHTAVSQLQAIVCWSFQTADGARKDIGL
ncbi:MAG: hypothetical protein CL583_17755 [Alteromonadaceae bacterium]|nr:hypothetical protein [Alteromonadaceae bacterium]|tara:strand:+ start:417 stop:698 length:282 start_codon:yes stop_codon:yes gene_type:complete